MRVAWMIAAMAPFLTGASQPLRLQPAGKWVLDYAAESCRLSRVFGTGAEEVTILFEGNAPGRMDLIAIGSKLATGRTQVAERFLPVQDEPLKGDVVYSSLQKRPAIYWSDMPMVSASTNAKLEARKDWKETHRLVRPPALNLEEEAFERAERQAFATAATELQIQPGLSRTLVLETGSMGPPVKAFDNCLRESLRSWGADPDLEDKIVRPAWSPDVHRWFGPSDYPPDMLRQGKESTVNIRLIIDATGKITKCAASTHYDEAAFNNLVCNLFMKRGHFEPAELADGTRVPTYYVADVTFRIAP